MTRSNFYAAGLAIVLLAIVANTALVLSNIEQVRSDESHTRTVQIQGGPVAVCLLDTMRAVAPLLLRVPAVEQPLSTYVRLQSRRYPGVKCPDKQAPLSFSAPLAPVTKSTLSKEASACPSPLSPLGLPLLSAGARPFSLSLGR